METQIAFAFDSAQVANRFLNALKSSGIDNLKAKLFRGSEKVIVSYCYEDKGFDQTAATLDDLASRYDGCEISIR
ncbi:hypothetical protein [Neptunicella sp. SCSIO 80796]|uniref:hypothetical protein n=1 Tax=Neptunicella plasticusilytica TaxID=3117012 RepID=UPI003A4E42B1